MTATLSVEGFQVRVMLLAVVAVTRTLVGVVGGWPSPPPPVSMVRESMLAPPPGVVAVARMVLVPGLRVVVMVVVVQVVQAPVGVKGCSSAVRVPLMVMSAGRLSVTPLA